MNYTILYCQGRFLNKPKIKKGAQKSPWFLRKCNKMGKSIPVIVKQRLLVHYKNELKVLDNRKMVKHVKDINLKLFFTYNKKENLRKVVRERGKTRLCH